MIVNKDPKRIISLLEQTQGYIESIISEYLRDYADYGWDSLTEDLSNISAQLYKDEIILRNASVKD